MARGYDPNKDYSKELQRNDLSSSERKQLEQERQNKINDKYGGREPNMTGSSHKFSDVYQGGSSRPSSSSSSGSSGGSWSTGQKVDIQKGPGYVTGGYTIGVNGTPILDKNPHYQGGHLTNGVDMSRRPDLAGKYAVSNGTTVFYDEMGYAHKAKPGAVDYLPHRDAYVADGSYRGGNLWTDEEMMGYMGGDAGRANLDKIAQIRAQMQAGKISGDEANRLANEIRSGYGYTIDKLGNVTDLGVSSTIAARRKDWGLPTGALNANQQKYLELMYPELGTKDPNTLLSAQSALHQGTYEPMQTPSYGGISGGSSGSMGGGFGDFDMDGSAFQYLKDLYAQQIAADLAALKSSYDQNMADMRAQDDLISSEYDRQRNQLAAQNDLQRMQMNEMGILQGLNTGATGQMALAQNVALQGGLAQLGSQESQSLADVALQRAKLAAQYRSASDQVAAQGNAQLAGALYDEYVRQQQMAWQYQQAIQEQQRWEQQFAYQQQQDQRNYASSIVSSMLSGGVMPDASILEMAGISPGMAQAYQQMVLGSINSTGSRSSGKRSSGGSKKGSGGSSGSSGLRNSSGVAVTPLPYADVLKNSSAGNYGSGYNLVLNDVQAKWARGADQETLAGIVEAGLLNGNLTNAGADSILRALRLNV